MTVDIAISSYLDDLRDTSTAWQRAFDDLAAGGGGRLRFDCVGEVLIKKTIVLPRISNVTFEGLGRTVSTIKGVGLGEAPLFEWQPGATASSDNVENWLWQNMTLRRPESGPIVRHRRVHRPGNRFKDCLVRNLSLSQATPSPSTPPGAWVAEAAVLEIEGILHSAFEYLRIAGGADGITGVRLRGSHALLRNVYAPDKSTAPTMFLDVQCTNSQISDVRTEGGNSAIADYWIHDCSNIEIHSLHSEGHQSHDILRIENCTGITLTSSGIAHQDARHPTNGIHFINAKYCLVNGGVIAARKASNSSGHAVVFDALSKQNTLEGVRLIGMGASDRLASDQILDAGTGNRWSVTDRDTVDGGTVLIRPG